MIVVISLVDVGEKDLREGGRYLPKILFAEPTFRCVARDLTDNAGLNCCRGKKLRNDRAMLRDDQAMMSGVI